MNHKFHEDVEEAVTKIVIDNEYTQTESAKEYDNLDFEAVVDMLECKRTEKDYEWMSDIFIPELPSIIMTEASSWTNQYFQTRDFVRVKPEGIGADKMAKAKAAELCINSTLNNRKLYHYSKYVRSRLINSLIGQVYALCWWEQKVVPVQIGVDIKQRPSGVFDEMGTPIIEDYEEPIMDEQIIVDQFNYEVLDPRNIFTNTKYVYSAQQKDWITVRSETSYDVLKQHEKELGYFNLDLVKDIVNPPKTEIEEKIEDKDNPQNVTIKTPISKLTLLQRFGKFWCIVEERDEFGNAITVKPGLGKDGEPLEKAELVETIIVYIVAGNNKILIRFQATPYIDKRGNTYKPLLRGQCYIHPSKDKGLSDGLFGRELQKAINDTANMSLDRVKLATLPVFKGRKLSLEDNSTVYIEPEHIIELENIDDLEELKISEDTAGALSQIGLFTNKLQQVTSVYPPAMGQIPGEASTTATAIASADMGTNKRGNFKSLTFEYTFLIEFYWMILTMTYAFARPETAKRLMAESVYDFDPDGEYAYTPVSSNIETEYNKNKKLALIDQMLGRVQSVPNPKTPMVLNYLLSKAFELLGSEFPDYKDVLFDTSPEAQQAAMQGGKGAGAAMPDQNISPISNQEGIPMSDMELNLRK